MHESGVAILLGAIFGLVIYYVSVKIATIVIDWRPSDSVQ